MGWSGGSEIAESVWTLVREFVPVEERQRVARKLVGIFEDEDADTMSEAEQLYGDAGLNGKAGT